MNEGESGADPRRLRVILDHCAIAVTSASGVVEYVSPAVARILGYAPDEVVGRTRASFRHPEDAAREEEAYRELLAHPGATRAFLGRSRHKNGEWRWIESVVTNLLEHPDVRAFVTNFRDASDRIAVLDTLLRSETNFRALVEGLPAPVLVHRDERIVYVNPAFLRALGYDDPAELIGRPAMSVVAEEYRAHARERVRRLEQEAGPARNPPTQGEMIRRDGKHISVLIEAQKLDFDGAPALVVVAIDLTERRELLARLSVADRMASIGTLAAGVAHEINNPLTYVLTNLSVLADEVPRMLRDPEHSRMLLSDVEHLLRDAREGASRMHGVVRDLLTLSRTKEEGVGPVDVRKVLESCLKIAGNELRHRAMVTRHYEDTPLVAASASRMGQLFLNLIINAAQAMPDGHAAENELCVTIRRGGAAEVVVEIRDTGSGIPRELHQRIFDPFFTTKPVGLGTGLGLAICHGIVRGLGGDIGVESEPGRGSTFRVTLPAAVPAAVHESSEGPAAAPHRGRILVVDDEPAIGTTLRLLLADEHDVASTTRARDALARIAQGERYDVILCDLMMPEMSGMELYEEILRTTPSLAERMVFLTGGAFTASAREFIERVPNARMEKPFAPDALRAVLHQMVG